MNDWVDVSSGGTWIREFNGDGVFRDGYGNVWTRLDDSIKMQAHAWDKGFDASERWSIGEFPDIPTNPYLVAERTDRGTSE